MKRFIAVVVVIVLFLVAVSFLIAPLTVSIVRHRLTQIFIHSDVSIGGCKINPLRSVRLFDIKIARKGTYEFTLKEAGVSYTPFSLLRRKILKAHLSGASVSINLPNKSLTEFNHYLTLKPSPFLVGTLEFSGVTLSLKSKEINLEGSISLEADLLAQRLAYLDLRIDSLDGQGVQLTDAVVKANQKKAEYLSLGSVKYNKGRLEELKGTTHLTGNRFSVDSLSAKLFNGIIKGDLAVTMDAKPAYVCHLNVEGLDLEKIAQDFELKEKMQMTGKLSGELTLEGSGADFKIVTGNLLSIEPGGMLVITDDTMLKNIGQNTGQSTDILVESFKNYHYNTGVVKLGLDQGNLVCAVFLEGEAGKRNLTIVLHEFKL